MQISLRSMPTGLCARFCLNRRPNLSTTPLVFLALQVHVSSLIFADLIGERQVVTSHLVTLTAVILDPTVKLG